MAVITIKDQAALTAALANARGGETFALAAGTYSEVALKSRTFATPITITSADATRPATVQHIALSGSSGVNFTNIDIGSALAAGEKIGSDTAAGIISNSSKITFDHVHVHGSMDNNASNDRYGLSFRGSSAIKITNSSFEQLTRAALFGTSNDILVQNNSFTHLRSDGLDFAAVQNVTVDGNYFHDYSPIAGDHPDAIQFWTSGTKVSSSDITITNNQIQFGGAQGAQGIFLNDEVGKLPYKRVTIDNNMVYVVAGYNGIYVANGEDVAVTNNSVLSNPSDRYKLRIDLGTIKRGTVANNVADILLTGSLKGVGVADNLWVQDDPTKLALFPNLSNGAATTYEDLVIGGKGYQPTTGIGVTPSAPPPVSTPTPTPTPTPVPVPVPTPASGLLLDVAFANGAATDTSGYSSKINPINGADIVGSGLNAAYKLGGNNYFEVAKAGATQLYGLSAFTLSFDLKRASTAASSDGSIMRVHNSWYVSENKGEIAFQYTSANGTTYKVTSQGANISDLASHQVDIAFDGDAGKLAFYVDGQAVGGGAIAGDTRTRQSWGLAVGNPFGTSFRGEIGGIEIAAGAKSATQIASSYTSTPAAPLNIMAQQSLLAPSLADTLASAYATDDTSIDDQSGSWLKPTTAGYLQTAAAAGSANLSALLNHA